MKNIIAILISILCYNISYSQCSVTATGDAQDCSGTNGKITITPSGGTAPYTYSIDNGGTSSSNPIFTNLIGGDYNILVIDANNCWAQTTVTIADPPSIYVINTVENCTATPGKFELLASHGTTPYEYSIDNGTTFSNVLVYNSLPGGYYDVILKDANGCISSSRDTVPFPLEIINLTSSNSCNGSNSGSISLDGNLGAGNYTYSFDGGVNFNSINNIANLSAGTFNVILKDLAGCEVPVDVLIEDFPAIQPVITTQDIPCNGGGNGSVNAIFSGTGIYDFTINGGTTTETGTTYNNTSLLEGNYLLEIIDAHNCEASFSFDIGEEKMADSVNKLNEYCYASNGEIEAFGYLGVAPFEYSFDNGTSFSPSGLLNNVSQGQYIIHVKDALGCTKIDTIQITNFGGIEAEASIADTICLGSSAFVSVTHNGGSGVDYNWDNGLSNSQSNIVSPSVTTNYTVIVTDNFGCKDTVETKITVDDVPVLQVNQTQFFACIGDTLEITATGADNYSWSTGDLTSSIEIEVEGVTSYTVVGSNGNCYDEETVDVIIKPMPSVIADANKTSISTHDSIFFKNTGSVASVYHWGFGDGISSNMSNPYHKFDFAGAYMVILTGTMGDCEAKDSILVYVGTVDITEETEENILAYPNPSKNFINIDIKEEASLSIFNINGKRMRTLSLKNGKNTISLIDYPRGVYIGKINTRKKQYQIKLVLE